MRRHHYALFFLVLLIVVIVIGWNRGWFTVNKQNIEQDKEKAVEKLKEGIDKLKPDSQKDANK
jgi:predicted negative regulator of RcsB-dependent stress response